MKGYVLDTSIVIKWFSNRDEAELDKALRLRREILESRCTVAVPDLLFYELSNALRYNPNLGPQDVQVAVKTVFDMGFSVSQATTRIMERAIELGFTHNITVYDSTFLALAEMERRLVVTADYKFFEKVKKLKYVIRLADLKGLDI